jgi:membrane-bound lytic murein transglycosylase A
MTHCITAPLRHAIAVAAAALLLAACTATAPPSERGPLATPARAGYTRVAWDDLPGYSSDRMTEAWPAFLAGCATLVANPRTETTWKKSCNAAAFVDATSETALRAFFAEHFSPYAVAAADGNRDGLVTGYYEPQLAGSRERTARFDVPLHGVPDDLLVVDLAALHPELADRRVRGRVEGRRVVPYFSRRDIEAGALRNAKVLAYVEDPLDAFFLQIQGSGRIALGDGTVMRLGYADQNGHPYRAIANTLIARGEMTLEQASMQSIREWARANPARLAEVLDTNPSYVFFREVPPAAPGTLLARIDGPLGSLGVPLLPLRTIAVDTRAVPLGAPVWIATTQPSTRMPLQRLVLAQDTGGAIRGAVRADFFWGAGDAAASEAGRMREAGRLWLLWPTDAPLP